MTHAVKNPVSFVSIQAFAKRASLSRGTVYNLVARGELPQPVRITDNRVAFPSDVVDAWFTSKLKAAGDYTLT